MEVTVTRREGVVRSFFWLLLLVVIAMTGYHLSTDTGGGEPQTKNSTADLEQQVTLLSESLEKNPGDLRTLTALGDTYLELGRNIEALRVFLQAEKINPKNAHILSDLGRLYQQTGQYDKALDSYRRAYESQPDHSGPLLNMALINSRHKKDYTKALELLQLFLASNPQAQLVATAEKEIARIKQVMGNANYGSAYDAASGK